MVIDYIVPIIVFLLIGGAAGVILTAAAKALEVESDETVEKILEHLPGINCGACGLSGCEAYAAAVKDGTCAPNLCKPGGEKTALGMSEVLGIKVEAGEREAAFVHCAGVTTEDKYVYGGTSTCAASERYYSGKGNCKDGCLGFGDCVRVCEYGAICLVDGVAVVNSNKCSACALCVKTCPNKLITLRKISEKVKIVCSSKSAGKVTRAVCGHGCIACGICVKKCPEGAVEVRDNHAVIDYNKCTNCGVCAGICPSKCIVN